MRWINSAYHVLVDFRRLQKAKKVYDEMENAGEMVTQGGMALVEISVMELERNDDEFLFLPANVGVGV